MNKRAIRHINNRDEGFTLLELMVTVAILVILLAIGAPQLQTFLVKRTVSTQADILASALRKARSEAVKRGQRVTICPSTNPEASDRSCATNSVDWSTGWLIFVDRGTAPRSFDSGDELLTVQQTFASTGGFRLDNSRVSISFAANGLAMSDNSTFRVRPPNAGESPSEAENKQSVCVVLAITGRVRVDSMNSAGQCPVSDS